MVRTKTGIPRTVPTKTGIRGNRLPSVTRWHLHAATPPNPVVHRGRSQPREVMAAPKQVARTSRSQPQNSKAAQKPVARASRSLPQKGKAAGKKAAITSRSQPQKVNAAAKQAAKASRSLPQKGKAAGKQAAKASGMQREKGIYVYGILPADIEVAGEMRGVGERPGPLGIVYSDGLAALISEVDLPERLGSPEDLRPSMSRSSSMSTESAKWSG